MFSFHKTLLSEPFCIELTVKRFEFSPERIEKQVGGICGLGTTPITGLPLNKVIVVLVQIALCLRSSSFWLGSHLVFTIEIR